MPKVTMKDFDIVPAGLYPAKLLKIEASIKKFGPCFDWTFQITQSIGKVKQGAQVTGLTSQQLTPKSKMAKWITAFGFNVAIDQDFELNLLIDKEAAVEVTVTPATDGPGFSNVTDVRSFQSLQAFQAAVQPPIQPNTSVQPKTFIQQEQLLSTEQESVTKSTPIATPIADANDEPLF